MINPLKLPKGVLDIFALGECDVILISDKNEHRPDLILDNDMYGEIINNYMSCRSPISCTKGKEYLIMSQLFKGTFMR